MWSNDEFEQYIVTVREHCPIKMQLVIEAKMQAVLEKLEVDEETHDKFKELIREFKRISVRQAYVHSDFEKLLKAQRGLRSK